MAEGADSGDADALAARVEVGTLDRALLELLAGVDDAAAQRALRRLPLVLTSAPPDPVPEQDAAPHAEPWLRWARQLEPYGRPLAARVALAGCELAAQRLDEEEPGRRSELVGLHTGPFGVLDITRAAAARLSPFHALAARVRAAVAAWIDAPSDAARESVVTAWPEELAMRLRVELVAELLDIDAHALWAHRWLVVLVAEPSASVSHATGCALAEAQSALGERAPVTRAVHGVLRHALLAV
jgi:hypothetical protein